MTSIPPETSQPVCHPAEIDVRQLLGPDQRTLLRLDNQIYTLRITRNGKLILTK